MAKDTNTNEKAVQKVEPRSALTPFDDMDRLFEGFFPRGWLRPMRWELPTWPDMALPLEGKMPRVDVIDRDDEVVVRAEVPGVDKKDLEVTMTDDSVTIKGSTRRERKEEKGNYYRCETSSGSFLRTVTLPSTVDSNKAKTTFKDGVLELSAPKIEKTKRRTIKVE